MQPLWRDSFSHGLQFESDSESEGSGDLRSHIRTMARSAGVMPLMRAA